MPIGAGARIYMGDAAAPMNTANGGASSDADLDNVTGKVKSFTIDTTMGTVDITKLNADLANYWREHAPTLRDATATCEFGDDTSGAFTRRVNGIAGGTSHVGGRGRVDIRVRPYGDGTGKLQLDFTAIPTTLPLGIELETEVGGSINWQVTGPITMSTQS